MKIRHPLVAVLATGVIVIGGVGTVVAAQSSAPEAITCTGTTDNDGTTQTDTLTCTHPVQHVTETATATESYTETVPGPTVTTTTTFTATPTPTPTPTPTTTPPPTPVVTWGGNFGSGADTTYYQGRAKVARIFLGTGALTADIKTKSAYTTAYNAGVRVFIVSWKDNNPTLAGQMIASFPTGTTVYGVYYHEPEDNFTGSQIQTWKNQEVANMAAVRANGGIPTIILMSWSTNPNSGRNINDYVLPAGTIDVLGYDYYPTMDGRTQAQCVAAMENSEAAFGVSRMLIGEYGVPVNAPTTGVQQINEFQTLVDDPGDDWETFAYFSANGTFDARFTQQTADAWFN